MTLRSWIGLAAVFLCACFNVVLSKGPSVVIKDATVIGNYGEAIFQGVAKPYKMFKGIPYATPPVGKLRFKKPKRLDDALPSPFMATEYSAGCLQPLVQDEMSIFLPKKQSEDCLYLNVFVPDQKPDRDPGHAVMVYIHGGAFLVGCGELGGEYLATFGNVIVVSINYRLGVFGFLGSETEEAPGNLGLWDQQLALKWVNENIAAFGGDNKRVTIFGESAGGISVIYQALYPGNEGLFQRVIAESGTPGIRFLFLHDIKSSLKAYAEMVGCKVESPKERIECLQEKTADEIHGTVGKLDTNERNLADARVFPYLDNDFVTIDPTKIGDLTAIEESEALKFFRSLDIINGVNSHEGQGSYTSVYIPIIDDPETFKPTREQMLTDMIPNVLASHYEPLDEPFIGMINSLYTDWSDPANPDRLREQVVKLLGDVMMVIPTVEHSRLHVNVSRETNSYIYYFTPVPSNPIIPHLSWVTGATHVEELGFVFFFHCFDERLPSNHWEYELSYDVMKYWSNFAKSG